MLIHQDRLFPAEASTRKIAKALYEQVRTLPIVSPHGHTQAAWFARNEPFPDPAKLFVQPDHYIYRMLYSQGISLEELEIGQPELKDARRVWRIFARHYYLFRGTPPRLGVAFPFQELFGWMSDCRKQQLICTSTRSRNNFARRSSCRAFFTSVLTWKCWRRPILRSIRWTTIRPSGNRTGRRGFCRPFAPTRLSTLSLRDLLKTSRS